jgi:hypothetical protein
MAKRIAGPQSGTQDSGKPSAVVRVVGGLAKLANRLGIISTPPAAIEKGMANFTEVFQGEGWMTPNTPMEPKEPEGTSPRRFQYQPGINISTTPRGSDEISFPMLRALSNYTLVRIVIERIKEAIKAHEWDIVADVESQTANYESDIAVVKDFLEMPDRRHTWDAWVGEVCEEVLSIDALALYVHRARDGSPWALEVIDGGTIKPLIDERGFEPLPPVPSYAQYLYGVSYAAFTKDEMLYRPRNRRAHKMYGFSPVEQIIMIVNMGLRREMHTLAQFTDGNMPAAFAKLPPDWSVEKIKAYNEYWNALLAGDPQNRAKLRWIPGGSGVGDVQKFHDEEVFGLKNEWDEWLARIICFAFGISPQAFIQMTNRAVAQELGDVEAEYGFASVKRFIALLVNEIIDDVLVMPHLQFRWITDRGRMAAKRIDRNEKYVKSSILSIDEVRAEEGKPPLGLKPGVMTGSGYVPFPPEAYITPPSWATMASESMSVSPIPGADVETPPTDENFGAAQVVPDSQPSNEPSVDGFTPEVEDVPLEAMAKAFDVCRDEELRKWERFALGRLERGRDVSGFVPQYIVREEAQTIERELRKAKMPDQISSIFSMRRYKGKLPPIRLRPPSTGEAGQFRSEIAAVLKPILEEHALRVAKEKGDKV